MDLLRSSAFLITTSIFVVGIVFCMILVKKRNTKDHAEEMSQAHTLTELQKKAFGKYFVDRDETTISSLGNSYIERFIADGTLQNGFSVISDKRVYFRGSCFTGSGKNLIKSDEERVVDLKDVTGSGFLYRRYVGRLLGIAAGMLAAVALCIALFIAGPDRSETHSYREMLQTAQTELKEAQQMVVELEKDPQLIAKLQDELAQLQDQSRMFLEYQQGTSGASLLSNYIDFQRITMDPYTLLSALLYADDASVVNEDTVKRFDDLIAAVKTLEQELPAFAQDSGIDLMSTDVYLLSYLLLGYGAASDELLASLYSMETLFFPFYGYTEQDYTDYVYSGFQNSFELMDSGFLREFLLAIQSDPECTPQRFFAEVVSELEDAKLQVQLLSDYIRTGASPLSQGDLDRIEELERQVERYQGDPKAVVESMETEVASIKSALNKDNGRSMMLTLARSAAASISIGLLLLFADYLRRRKTYFEINYAGGKIAFDVSLYPKAEIEDFQKQLRRAKDFVSAAAVQAPVVVPEPPAAATGSKADELEKYVKLLEKGVIDQEEFAILKRRVLEE